jgi:hypothetical protein
MVLPASSAATLTLVRTALSAYSCGVCTSSVTSCVGFFSFKKQKFCCVGGGFFNCFTCLPVPYSTVTVTRLDYFFTIIIISSYFMLAG